MSFKKSLLILLFIVLVAIALRLVAILNTESFWFDEIISLKIAEKGIAESWQYLKWENNPPVHYWYLHYWLKLFGQNEFALRFSSVFLSTFNVLLIYFLGKNLVNKKTGLFAAFIMAISSYQIYLSSDARMYPLLLFFGLGSLIFYWQLFHNSKRYSWPFYLLFTILAYYTHLTGFLLLFVQNIYFLYHYFFISKQISWPRWLLGQTFTLLVLAPWLISFFITHLDRLDSTAWYFNTGSQGLIYLQIPLGFLLVLSGQAVWELVIFILFLFLVLMSFVDRESSQISIDELKIKFKIKPSLVFVWLLFLVPIFFSLILEMWVVKYFSLGSLGLYLILALGFNNLKINFRRELLVALLIFILLVPVNANLFKTNRHAWQAVITHIENQEQPGDLIIIGTYVYKIIFDYYYRGQEEVVGFGPAWLDRDTLLNAVKYNWYPILTADNLPDVARLTANKKRVIVLNPDKTAPIHRASLLFEELTKAGWQVKEEKKFGGFEQPAVLLLERTICP